MSLQPANTAKARQLLNETMALVLAGGRGSRLKQLTDDRAKPAVHFGGKFRIIDFVLSNCVNSGIRRIGGHPVQVPQPAASPAVGLVLPALPDERVHRAAAGPAARGRGQLVSRHRRCGLPESRHHSPARPQVRDRAGGDHIYKMDYAAMLLDHVNLGSRTTVACIEVPRQEARPSA